MKNTWYYRFWTLVLKVDIFILLSTLGSVDYMVQNTYRFLYHQVSFAIDQGVSPDHASILMMIMGATTAVGRIMFGKIVQYGVLHRLQMHQLSMLVTGTGVMILPLLNTYPCMFKPICFRTLYVI